MAGEKNPDYSYVDGFTIIQHRKLARTHFQEYFVNLMFDPVKRKITVYIDPQTPQAIIDKYLNEEYGLGKFIKREDFKTITESDFNA